MFKHCRLSSAVAALSLSASMLVQAQETPLTLEKLAEQIKTQQAQIEALTAQIESQEKAGSGAGWFNRTSVGGYGEAYFKRIEGQKDEFDAYRLILFVGHQFNDKVRFSSELEFEHAYGKDTDTSCTIDNTAGSDPLTLEQIEVSCGKPSASPGYFAVEQLFLEYQYAQKHRASAGQLLVPVGILNETHEPDTFYGVFRAPVEREIIPGTWFETGLMFSGEVAPGFSYDAMISSGMKNDGSKAVKEGRQRGAKADGSDLAYTVRFKYTGMPGLELAVTWHEQQDMSQGAPKVTGENLEANLLEAHVAYQKGAFGLRTLYAEWDLAADALAVADKKNASQKGWYVEPSWKITPGIGVFARYSEWDNAAADSTSSDWQESSVGVNWWLHERAVVKADWQHRDDPAASKKDQDGFNVGIGFSF